MRIMNKSKFFIATAMFVCGSFVAAAQKGRHIIIKQQEPMVHVRYESGFGFPSSIKTRINDSTVFIKNRYVDMSDSCLFSLRGRLEDLSCQTFWYEITPDNTADYYRISAKAKKQSVGLYANYLFRSSRPDNGTWLQDGVAGDFGETTFRVADFSLGVFAGRQLFAKNRHQLSVELALAYRRIREKCTVDHYSTSYPAIDADGDPYIREITVDNYTEKTAVNGIAIPIDLRYDAFVHKKVSVFAAVGIENDLMLGRRSKAGFDACYVGHYGPEFFDVTLNQNGLYDFGVFQELALDQKGNFFRYDLYGTLGLGVQVFVNDMISLEAAGTYMHRMAGTPLEGGDPGFVLSTDADSFQSLTGLMKPAAANRLGVVLRVKATF